MAKYKGPLPKPKPPKNARPNHPMNTEKTTGLKEDPVYKAGGGKILNCRSQEIDMKTCPGCPTPKKCTAMGKCLNKPNSDMKMDPQYKSSGGTVFKGRQ